MMAKRKNEQGRDRNLLYILYVNSDSIIEGCYDRYHASTKETKEEEEENEGEDQIILYLTASEPVSSRIPEAAEA